MTESNITTTSSTTEDKNSPVQPSNNDAVPYAVYQKMVNKMESMAKALEELKGSGASKKEDFTKDVLDNNKKEKLEEEQKDKLVADYADVKSNFDKYIDKNIRDEIEGRLKGCSKLTDKINSYAKVLIRKAFNDTESTNALIESFKTDATQEDSAFRLKLQDSIQILQANKSSVTDSLFDKRVSDFSVEELKNLRKDLIDHRTRNEARKKAISWGLISA